MFRKSAIALAAAMFALIAGTAGADAGTPNERRQVSVFRMAADPAPAVRAARLRSEPAEEKPVTTPNESATQAGYAVAGGRPAAQIR